jgi:hypothetical protein
MSCPKPAASPPRSSFSPDSLVYVNPTRARTQAKTAPASRLFASSPGTPPIAGAAQTAQPSYRTPSRPAPNPPTSLRPATPTTPFRSIILNWAAPPARCCTTPEDGAMRPEDCRLRRVTDAQSNGAGDRLIRPPHDRTAQSRPYYGIRYESVCVSGTYESPTVPITLRVWLV